MTVFFLTRSRETGSNASGIRVGLTVSKALGGAVQRNRIRRRLREAVRLHGLPHGMNADVVINPKRSLLDAQFSVLQDEVAWAFEIIEKTLAKEKPRP